MTELIVLQTFGQSLRNMDTNSVCVRVHVSVCVPSCTVDVVSMWMFTGFGLSFHICLILIQTDYVWKLLIPYLMTKQQSQAHFCLNSNFPSDLHISGLD